jgi:signal transduction histidine kinase
LVKLTQILVNLLSNAIKFTALGGTVRLTVRRRGLGGITLRDSVPGQGTTVSVHLPLKPPRPAGEC